MAVTFGSGAAPSQVTLNLDSLFGISLAAYRKTLVDNIGAINAFFHELIKSELYESQDGGSYIQEPLMYALTPADSYDGYDELSTLPTDGITDAIFQWRQCAAAIVYSMKEIKQNKQKIVDLVKARIMQAEMGLQEYFSQSLLWGAAADGGSLTAPRVSPVNGSNSIDPLPLLISFDPTVSTSIGNINQNTSTWWRNKTFTSAAAGYDAFLLELDHAFNNTSLGTGGKVNIVLADETSYELFVHALYQKYRQIKTNENFPFENTVYKNATVTMDDKVPDAYSGTTSTATYGTFYLMNSKFFKMRYEEDSDFEMLKDENGKTFQKPVNGDSRVAHVAWMGNLTVNNRRKQGVFGKIARTLTTP
jgi:hypothetical protein